MCKTDSNILEVLVPGAVAAGAFTAPAVEPVVASRGSRRRRLWELDPHAQCPVLGVCIPMAVLRKVVDKALGGKAIADDYELHCGAVADCKHRSAVAEALQRELDRRYALALHKAARLKTADALAAWWDESLRSHNIAGPFWAILTHPRCPVELSRRVEGQVHMLQHQVGMATRVDHDRLEALQARATELTGELADATRRAHLQSEDHARQVNTLEAGMAQLRAQLLAMEATVASQKAELQALETAVPDLKVRAQLSQEIRLLHEQRGELQRALLQARQEAQRQRCRADELGAELRRRDACVEQVPADTAEAPPPASAAGERAVLCVGGRPASVPMYRQLIEETGRRFLHHDGGEEDNAARLDATLAAADLVICQTGCVSHDAYWRVKDHCKRTGKRCIFVETPSQTGLRKALMALAPTKGSVPA